MEACCSLQEFSETRGEKPSTSASKTFAMKRSSLLHPSPVHPLLKPSCLSLWKLYLLLMLWQKNYSTSFPKKCCHQNCRCIGTHAWFTFPYALLWLLTWIFTVLTETALLILLIQGGIRVTDFNLIHAFFQITDDLIIYTLLHHNKPRPVPLLL